MVSDQGRDEDVLALGVEAAELQRRNENPLGASYTTTNQGCALRNLGRMDEARTAFQEAEALAWSVPSPRAAALAVGNLGSLDLDLGNHDAAATALDEAITLAHNLDPRFEGGFLAERARVEIERGRPPGDRLQRARALMAQGCGPADLALLATVEALELARQGRTEEARALVDGLPALRSTELERRRAELAARLR